MGRVHRVVGVRNRGARVWVVSGVVIAALALAVPAFGTWGSNPSKECSSSSWNGKYWKAEIGKSFSIKSIESNVSKSLISLDINKHKKATWSLKSSSDHAVFRIYEKGGQYNRANGGFWLPGEGGTFLVEKSISHITFCFTDIPEPKVSITKTTNGADPTASDPNYIRTGDPVTWKYVVKNTGSVALKDIVVTDDKEGTIGSHSGPLNPGKTLTFEKSAAAERSAFPDGYTNVATVKAKSKIDGSSVEASDNSGYYGAEPSISIVVDDPDGPILLGSEFEWGFTVTNTGNVPLSGVVVDENGVTVGDCSLGVLLPAAFATCTLTETATLGQESSTFVAKGIFDDGEAQNVISETTETLTYEINQPPMAEDDTYEMPERDPNGPVTLMVDAAAGVLANDTDPDDTALTASGATVPTNGGLVTLNSDGSFSYTPSGAYAWAADQFSRVDVFEYVVSDGRGGSDQGMVSITVNRVVCIGESVEDIDGVVKGVFTLLETTNDPCKHYEVDAQAEAETPSGELITLEIPGDDSNPSLFRGMLTFSPESLTPEGELILGVEYDPDLTDGVQLRTLPVCVDPEFIDGLIVGAALPQENGGVEDTWCLGGLVGLATGPDGEIEVTYQVIGLEDPGFSAR